MCFEPGTDLLVVAMAAVGCVFTSTVVLALITSPFWGEQLGVDFPLPPAPPPK